MDVRATGLRRRAGVLAALAGAVLLLAATVLPAGAGRLLGAVAPGRADAATATTEETAT
jgi:hypothetical protein